MNRQQFVYWLMTNVFYDNERDYPEAEAAADAFFEAGYTIQKEDSIG